MLSTAFKQYFVNHLTSVAGRVFFVYGMRRSGNHAFIQWLINALEASETELMFDPGKRHLRASASGATCFVNALNDVAPRTYRRDLWRYRKTLHAARNVIVSVEDETDEYAAGWRIPSAAETICVRRRPLNLIASRFQHLQQSARRGRGEAGLTMNEKFFDRLIRMTHSPVGHVWQFEQWNADRVWRRRFLESLGLETDSNPGMTFDGGGSSFSGMAVQPTASDLNSRFPQIEPNSYWKEFLTKVVSQHPTLFSTGEHSAITAFLAE